MTEKNIQRKKMVVFLEQTWKSFETPPEEYDGIGPSGNHIWIYSPINKTIFDYINWSGSETLKYKKEKCMWCYILKPEIPK